ncbi:MAG: hypothetical protein OXE99_01460, partial [Cellvibrionales bacterium]|nr:hypothetical protein [Cellvibrionales bacterium]
MKNTGMKPSGSLWVGLSVLLSGCLSSLDNQFFTQFDVVYPAEYRSSAPITLLREDIDEGADPIVINFPEGTATPLNLYFNGQNVSECYSYTETQATAAFHCMREYIRQGKNTIAVNPQSLFLGTTRTFMLDTEGTKTN